MSRTKLIAQNQFEFEGAKLNYRVVGSGEPVVLLHGSMISDPWNGFERLLGKYFRVYLPELPGFGASEPVEGKVHDIEMFTRAFGAFVDMTGLRKVPVVAFSLGTIVAIKAAKAGMTNGRLILVGMPVTLESQLLPKVLKLPIEVRRKLAVNELARGGILLSILKEVIGTADRNYVFKYLSLLRTSDVRAMVDGDIQIELPKVIKQDLPGLDKNRIVFIYGEKDKLRIGADKILRREFINIKGAGHDIFVSKPQESLGVLREILIDKKTWLQKVYDWWINRI